MARSSLVNPSSVLAVTILSASMTWLLSPTPAEAGRTARGAVIGAGVGALVGGGKGAAVGAATGAIVGSASKRKRKYRRRY